MHIRAVFDTKLTLIVNQLTMDPELTKDEAELEEDAEDEDASLDDSLLDEIEGVEDEEEADDFTEGFGELPVEVEAEPKEAELEEDDAEPETEEDAEDVDYDTFDDVDEM